MKQAIFCLLFFLLSSQTANASQQAAIRQRNCCSCTKVFTKQTANRCTKLTNKVISLFEFLTHRLLKQTMDNPNVGINTLIFDFDGTIADSLPLLHESINKHAEHYGYKKIEDLEQLRSKETQEIMKELAVPLLKLPLIANTLRKDMRSNIVNVKPCAHMIEIITQLHHRGFVLGIVSSNSTENIQKFLYTHNLTCFTLIHGGSSLFGKGTVLKHFLTRHNLKASNVLYIGDEVRDIEAAQENNIRCVAVTWGFHTEQRLLSKKPDYIIQKPHELLEVSGL